MHYYIITQTWYDVFVHFAQAQLRASKQVVSVSANFVYLALW
jgi:hypothetical protein